jgi:hypothetical protein
MSQHDLMRWIRRGIMGVTLVLGWIFILWQNTFYVDVPVVVVALGYLAVVLAITNLWRVGAATVAPEDRSEEAWSRPLGERGGLEKEKKTLLKAIKEAEFDQAMGKLSKADADQLIQMYRTRAIEVIKELERLEAGAAETPRQKIEREVAARLAIAEGKEQAQKKAKGADAKGNDPQRAKAKSGVKIDAAAAAKTDAKTDAAAAAKTDAKTDAAAAATIDAAAAATTDAKAAATTDAKTDAKTDAETDAATDAAAAATTDAAAAAAAAATTDAAAAATTDAKTDAAPDAKTDAAPDEVVEAAATPAASDTKTTEATS